MNLPTLPNQHRSGPSGPEYVFALGPHAAAVAGDLAAVVRDCTVVSLESVSKVAPSPVADAKLLAAYHTLIQPNIPESQRTAIERALDPTGEHYAAPLLGHLSTGAEVMLLTGDAAASHKSTAKADAATLRYYRAAAALEPNATLRPLMQNSYMSHASSDRDRDRSMADQLIERGRGTNDKIGSVLGASHYEVAQHVAAAGYPVSARFVATDRLTHDHAYGKKLLATKGAPIDPGLEERTLLVDLYYLSDALLPTETATAYERHKSRIAADVIVEAMDIELVRTTLSAIDSIKANTSDTTAQKSQKIKHHLQLMLLAVTSQKMFENLKD